MVSLLPLSWKGGNSGVSRNRPLRTPSSARKLPILAFPKPSPADPPGEPKEPYVASTLPNRRGVPSPERVVMLATRLLLSPNSASGVPVTGYYRRQDRLEELRGKLADLTKPHKEVTDQAEAVHALKFS